MKFTRIVSICLVMIVGGLATIYLPRSLKAPVSGIALVNNVRITQRDLSLRLRDLLWRQGKDWDQLGLDEQLSIKSGAVDTLIEAQLIKQWSREHPGTLSGTETEEDFQQFLKQFESPEGWKARASLQGLNEPQLRERLAEETKQQAALNAYLKINSRVSDEEAQEWFRSHQEKMLMPECVRASHIFLTSHDQKKPDRVSEIKSIYQTLLSKEATFSELAAKFSEDDRSNKKGGDLDWFTRKRVPKEFADIVFNLTPNEISKPFQTALGWHIVWQQDHHAERSAEFAEVQAEITSMLESRKRETSLKSLLQELRHKAQIVRNEDIIRLTKPSS